MMMLIGPRPSRGAHDSRAPSGGACSMKVCGFSRSPGSVDSWTPGPKPLCHRHPTGPHPSGLLWTPAEGDSTKSKFALAGPQRPDRVVAAEEVEQGAQRLAAIRLQLGVAVDDQAGVVLRGLQQLAMGGEVGQAHVGHAALACAEQLAGAAQLEVLLVDA